MMFVEDFTAHEVKAKDKPRSDEKKDSKFGIVRFLHEFRRSGFFSVRYMLDLV